MANTAQDWICEAFGVDGSSGICPTLQAPWLARGKRWEMWSQEKKIKIFYEGDATLCFYHSTCNLCPGNYTETESDFSRRIHQQILPWCIRDWKPLCFSSMTSKPKEKAQKSSHWEGNPYALGRGWIFNRRFCIRTFWAKPKPCKAAQTGDDQHGKSKAGPPATNSRCMELPATREQLEPWGNCKTLSLD